MWCGSLGEWSAWPLNIRGCVDVGVWVWMCGCGWLGGWLPSSQAGQPLALISRRCPLEMGTLTKAARWQYWWLC